MTDSDDGLPTNHELGERMARIEENQRNAAESLDRIDESLNEELTKLRKTQQNDLAPKVQTLWTGYRLLKWAGGSAGLLALVTGAVAL